MRPDLPDLPSRDAGISGHQPDAPMGGLPWVAVGRQGQGQDFLDLVSTQLQGLPAARQVLQTVEARIHLALAPFEHG